MRKEEEETAFISFGTYLAFYYMSLKGNNLCENSAHGVKISHFLLIFTQL